MDDFQDREDFVQDNINNIYYPGLKPLNSSVTLNVSRRLPILITDNTACVFSVALLCCLVYILCFLCINYVYN